ncbi:unnamed protein product [Caretta caretta]
MNKLRQSLRRKKPAYAPEASRPHQWQADEEAVRRGKCSFPVRYLGHAEVEESRGMHVCEEAVKKLKTSGRKSVKSVLWVSADGLRVVDDKTKDLIVDQTIEKVSFCAPDRNFDKAFSYICRDGTARRWICHCFLALKDSGERLSHAVGCAFAACLERKQKREQECGVTASFGANRTSFARQGSFRAPAARPPDSQKAEAAPAATPLGAPRPRPAGQRLPAAGGPLAGGEGGGGPPARHPASPRAPGAAGAARLLPRLPRPQPEELALQTPALAAAQRPALHPAAHGGLPGPGRRAGAGVDPARRQRRDQCPLQPDRCLLRPPARRPLQPHGHRRHRLPPRGAPPRAGRLGRARGGGPLAGPPVPARTQADPVGGRALAGGGGPDGQSSAAGPFHGTRARGPARHAAPLPRELRRRARPRGHLPAAPHAAGPRARGGLPAGRALRGAQRARGGHHPLPDGGQRLLLHCPAAALELGGQGRPLPPCAAGPRAAPSPPGPAQVRRRRPLAPGAGPAGGHGPPAQARPL